MSKNISYHTRLHSDNAVKVVGGSFGGSVDAETVDRLVKSHFDVAIANSGRAVFVDKSGRWVSLYISVDPATTEKGKTALAAWRVLEARANQERQEVENAMAEEIQDLIDGLPHDEIIRRLKGA